MTLVLKHTADDKKTGLTLAGLRAFVAECDRAAMPDDATLRVRTTGLKLGLREIEATEPTTT